jgi:hypothetical protein
MRAWAGLYEMTPTRRDREPGARGARPLSTMFQPTIQPSSRALLCRGGDWRGEETEGEDGERQGPHGRASGSRVAMSIADSRRLRANSL